MPLNRKIAYIEILQQDIEIKPDPHGNPKKIPGGQRTRWPTSFTQRSKGLRPVRPDNWSDGKRRILTATCASATARTHVMAKSPLTGLLGSSNMGDFSPLKMAWAGFHHLVIKGKAKKPSFIYIHNARSRSGMPRCMGVSVTEHNGEPRHTR